MNAKLYNQMEIAFWDFVIYTLSESKWVRNLVRVAHRFFSKCDLSRTVGEACIAALVGLFSGVLLYLLAFHFG